MPVKAPAAPGASVRGVSAEALEAHIAALGEGALDGGRRRAALERFAAMPAPGPQPGRYWRVDLNKFDYGAVVPFTVSGDARPVLASLDGFARAASFVQVDSHVVHLEAPAALRERGVIVCSLDEAAREHPAEFTAAFGTVADPASDKFGALALAFQSGGAFVHVPAGVRIDDPVVVTYVARDAALFPYTLVSAGEGASVTVIEQVRAESAHAFVSSILEADAQPRASIVVATIQECPADARVFAFRRARAAQDATVRLGIVELGGAYVRTDARTALGHPGGRAEFAGLFFAVGEQHVDMTTEVDHTVGPTTSDTVVKSAASEHGQARYLGNIRIAAHAHGCDASLRDDSLLLSKTAHVDSIPALEIAANDVKAFHGATVGAIDADEIFYAMSRGIDRSSAERMIALGFFEPAIALLPAEALRAHVRAALAAKIPDMGAR